MNTNYRNHIYHIYSGNNRSKKFTIAEQPHSLTLLKHEVLIYR